MAIFEPFLCKKYYFIIHSEVIQNLIHSRTSMNVGILGATGAVGQKFIRLLNQHPWFNIAALGASDRSAGKAYKEAANWIEDVPLPQEVAQMTVQACTPETMQGVDFVFSGLDSSVATEIEGAFAKAGIPVISNAKNYRQHADVPLLIPEVNPEHIDLIHRQSFSADGKGWIVTNPNCVAVPLSLALKPLHDRFGLENLSVTTLQALSGAGYPGVPSLDIIANVVPYISGEEPKIAPETQKILGLLQDGDIQRPSFTVDATCTRVHTLNGHMAAVSCRFKEKPSSLEQVVETLKNFKNPIAELDLPFSPVELYHIHSEENYPQPRLHADRDKGMSLHIGRLREGDFFHLNFVCMAHNTIRGAAGGAILNAELLMKKGLFAS